MGTGTTGSHFISYFKSVLSTDLLSKNCVFLYLALVIGTNTYCQQTTRRQVDSLHTVAMKMIHSNEKRVLQITDSTYDLARDINYNYSVSKSHMIKARVKDLLGHHYTAHLLFKESLFILKSSDTTDYYNEIGLLRNLGRSYHIFKQYNTAIVYFDSSLLVLKKYINTHPDLVKQYGDHKLEPWIISDKAGNYRLTGEIDKSIDLLIQAEDLARSFNDHQLVYVIRNEHGLIHLDLDNFSKSREHYQFIVDNSENPSDLTHAFQNIATSFFKEKDYQQSEQYYRKAIETSYELNDPSRTFKSFLFMGQMLAEKTDTSAAIATWEKALQIYPNIEDDSENFIIYQYLRDAYFSRSISEFLKYMRLYDQANNGFIDNQKKMIEDNQIERFNLIDQSYEERKANEKANGNETNFLSKMIILSIVIGIILIALIVGYMKSTKNKSLNDFGTSISKTLIR